MNRLNSIGTLFGATSPFRLENPGNTDSLVAQLNKLTKPTTEEVAAVCHAVNNAYCEAIGDPVSPPWNEAPEWQRASIINGVEFHLANPEAGPEGSHANWMQHKAAEGWVVGPVKNAEKKEHPCMVAYDKLPPAQRTKDALFVAVVRAMTANDSL